MADPTRVQAYIHDLLDEANAMLLTGIMVGPKAEDLATRLLDCAQQAHEAGLIESEIKLLQTADQIVKRLSEHIP